MLFKDSIWLCRIIELLSTYNIFSIESLKVSKCYVDHLISVDIFLSSASLFFCPSLFKLSCKIQEVGLIMLTWLHPCLTLPQILASSTDFICCDFCISEMGCISCDNFEFLEKEEKKKRWEELSLSKSSYFILIWFTFASSHLFPPDYFLQQRSAWFPSFTSHNTVFWHPILLCLLED